MTNTVETISLPRLTAPARLLVFRIGQLGDTVVSLPAMWAVRRWQPQATLTLMSDRHRGRHYVLAEDLLRGTGLFADFLPYVIEGTWPRRLLQPLLNLRLMLQVRARRFDAVVYLAPSTRTRSQVTRDLTFFRGAGLTRVIGADWFVSLPRKNAGQPLGATPREADLLLQRLATDGVPVPPSGRGEMDLRLGETELADVSRWLQPLSYDGGRPWIGVGPGSKMSAKLWPEERFGEAVGELIRHFDVWPVVFGGADDRAMGERLLRRWMRGYSAAGHLSLRAAAAALARCRLFLGNDTGTMHLAAAAGIPCVAVFSAREWPGMWHPYRVPSRVLRSAVDCEGCGLTVCSEHRNRCLTLIPTEMAVQACAEFLQAPS